MTLSDLLAFFLMVTASRPEEAGTVASSSAHLLSILPQPADPQQVSEGR